MDLSLFSSLYQNGKNFDKRNMSLSKIFQYFIKLMMGELTGGIYYKKLRSDNVNQIELISNMKTIDLMIRKALTQTKIENYINIEMRKGFENIGYGCFVSPLMFGNLMAVTQGEASFYFPTLNNKKHLLKISLLSIPKMSGIVKFEENTLHRFSISALSNYNIDIEIKPEDVHETLSKVSILVDRHWSPKYLDKNFQDLPLGVIIRSMSMVSA